MTPTNLDSCERLIAMILDILEDGLPRDASANMLAAYAAVRDHIWERHDRAMDAIDKFRRVLGSYRDRPDTARRRPRQEGPDADELVDRRRFMIDAVRAFLQDVARLVGELDLLSKQPYPGSA